MTFHTFMFWIDGHLERVLAKIDFRNIDPLTVYIVFVDIVAANGNTFFRTAKKKFMKY